MSRGLSSQQRAILGLGVRINRAVNGGEVVPIAGEPVKYDRWRIPALCAPGFAEVTTRYVLHLLYDVPLTAKIARSDEVVQRNGGFFAHTARTRSLKASVTRAITSLLEREFVAFRPSRRDWPSDPQPVGPLEKYDVWIGKAEIWAAKLTEGDQLAIGWGHALRPRGIEVGLAHEPDLGLVAVLEGVLALQNANEPRVILERRIETLRLANVAGELRRAG